MRSRLSFSASLMCLLLLALASCQSAPNAAPVPTVTGVPAAAAASTPAPLPLTGRPIHGDRPEVYRVMEDGQVRHVGDMSTLMALAYDAHDLVTVSDQTLAGYP